MSKDRIDSIDLDFIKETMPKLKEVVAHELSVFFPIGIESKKLRDTLISLGASFFGTVLKSVEDISGIAPDIEKVLTQFKAMYKMNLQMNCNKEGNSDE